MASEREMPMRSASFLCSEGSATIQSKLSAWRNVALHDRCSVADMLRIREAFEQADNHKMWPEQFRSLLKTSLNVDYDDDEFKIMFLKMNTSLTGQLVWGEVVSHLMLGYFGNDEENQRQSLQPPILGQPVLQDSQHRHPISRIRFCPDVEKDRSTDDMQGKYVTASRDGMINWWTLDMKLLRTAYSSCPHLKVRSTWVTDMVCMPDVNIIVTSSTERDLRFYDCTANTFTLKLIITSWEYMICTMHYRFCQDINKQCKLICGDVGGYVRVLLFSPVLRGPFKNEPGTALTTLQHVDLQKRPKRFPKLRLVELARSHGEWVRQVSYYGALHCVVSCATSPDSLLISDIRSSDIHSLTVFTVEKGIQCFEFNEEAHILVTGGPDCVVRVWNPFVPTKPILTFVGHHACITCIVLQNEGQTIYSLSTDRVIKVWDVRSQACVQSYIDIPEELCVQASRFLISAVYNRVTHQFIMACVKIAIVQLEEQLNPLHTDGFTHSGVVSKVLFNPLFKVIVTCGMDSFIINWDPTTGKRNVVIRDAHVRLLHGEEFPVEITATCFDPGHQLLLTGARSGELKVWNFNTGECVRQMSIEHMCEVTGCFWVEGRILAVGWNRHVVEFEDMALATTGKCWETRHTDDVLAAALRPPHTLVTASYNSELILWKLETGQPYKQFSCLAPTQRVKMYSSKREVNKHANKQVTAVANKSEQKEKPFLVSHIRKPNIGAVYDGMSTSAAIKKAKGRRVSTVALPVHAQNMRHLAAHACIFLRTRPQHVHVASFLVALENGQVQCWSDHSAAGYLGSFQAIHMTGDYVSSLATDVDNEFLFTGTLMGYVKVWLMSNYLVNSTVHVNMPRLRLQFPFLWRDRIEGRAKRSTRDQPLPLLLNSYRAHIHCVTSIGYVDEHKLLFTGSSDYSVWRGGFVSRYVPGRKKDDRLRDITQDELKHQTYGEPLTEPLLGKHFVLPTRSDPAACITLDDSLSTIPLYTHLRLASTQPVRRPATPELIRRARLKPTKIKKAHFETPPRELHHTQL